MLSDFEKVLREGATINQLAKLFDLNWELCKDRLVAHNVTPISSRSGKPTYRVAEAARVLVDSTTPGGDDPKAKRAAAAQEKDFWDAQLKRQKFMEQAGDLWRTEQVVEVFAGSFKQVREAVVVFLDELEHESGLPPAQIEKSKALGDMLLQGMYDRLTQMQIDTSLDHDLPDTEQPVPAESEPPLDDFFASIGLA